MWSLSSGDWSLRFELLSLESEFWSLESEFCSLSFGVWSLRSVVSVLSPEPEVYSLRSGV